MVHEEGLEGIEIEGGGWQHIQWVGFFLYWLFFIIITSGFFLGSLWCFFLLFFLGWGLWLDALGSEFNVSESLGNFWQVNNLFY